MKRRLTFLLKIFIALVLLLVIYKMIEQKSIIDTFKSARFELVLAGLLLMPLNILLQEYKWRYLVRLVKPEVRFTETLASLLGGYAFGIVTPGRIGEYGRVIFIRDTPPLKLIGLTVMDKFYNWGCISAFGLPAVLTLPTVLGFLKGYLTVTMIIMLVLIDLALLYLALDPKPVRSLIYALQMLFPKEGKISRILGGLDRFGTPQARKVLTLTLLYYIVFQFQYFFLICSFTSIDIFSSIRAAAAILFTKLALPISIGDLGLDQLVSIGYFGEFGVTNAQALNASILLFAINVLLPSLIGVIFVIRLQFRKKPGAFAS